LASIKIIDAGFYTSLQDKGRLGYGAIGVPESGAMDQQALELSNLLLNNPADTAVMECTLLGPSLLFLEDMSFVLTGALSNATLDTTALDINQVYFAKENQVLTLGKVSQGCRMYLGVDGGFDSEVILGSRSLFYPITQQGSVKKGDQFTTGDSNFGTHKGGKIQIKKESLAIYGNKLQVFKGPEYELLSPASKKKLRSTSFSVNSYNRMGISLNYILEPHTFKMVTGPVLPGTVQLTPSGRLLVLMRDCQTTGGYPRVLQLTESAINALGQKKSGDFLQFVL